MAVYIIAHFPVRHVGCGELRLTQACRVHNFMSGLHVYFLLFQPHHSHLFRLSVPTLSIQFQVQRHHCQRTRAVEPIVAKEKQHVAESVFRSPTISPARYTPPPTLHLQPHYAQSTPCHRRLANYQTTEKTRRIFLCAWGRRTCWCGLAPTVRDPGAGEECRPMERLPTWLAKVSEC